MREFFDLANNPLFVKHVRSRLRRGAIVPAILLIAFLCAGIIIIDMEFRRPNAPAFEIAPKIFFYLQGLILMLIGGAQVASAVAHIKDTGIIDFHRVTPMPAKVQTIGIILGAPIRELVLFTVTLPFSFYAAASGWMGITNWCKLLVVQIGLAMLYYTVAMVTGLSATTSGKGASGKFVFLFGIMNVLSANMLYPAGIYGPTLLTPVPVYEEVFEQDEDNPRNQMRQAARQQQAMQQAQPQGPGQQPPRQQFNVVPPKPSVTFYSAAIPVVLQSLLFQGTFIAFFFIAASRRMRSGRLPMFSKPIAVSFMSAIAFLSLGSAWDAPNLVQVLGLLYFLGICAICLTSSITPPLGEVVKGIQRAQRMSGSNVPRWSDLASNNVVVSIFAATVGVACALSILLAPKPPLLFFVLRNPFEPWAPVAVGVLTILASGFAQQYMNLAYHRRAASFFTLFIVGVWFVPLGIGGLLSLSDSEVSTFILALTPLAGIAFAGGTGIGACDPGAIRAIALMPGALMTVVFGLLLINEKKKLRASVLSEKRDSQVKKEFDPSA